MDYWYMYTKGGTKKTGADALPTHEIRTRLEIGGRSDKGSRQVVLNIYREHLRQCGEQEGDTEETVTLASQNPLMVLLDEETGNKYMRAADQKCHGDEGSMSWLVQDMHQ
ncbi:hypothetical protein N9L68_06735 [bacterium]|nr:hypothetical protein [bacterium]